MENPVIIFGAGALGKAALEIFESNEIPVYCFLDDDNSLHGQEIRDVSIIGSTEDEEFLKYLGKKCEAILAEDDNKVRKSLVSLLNEKWKTMPVNAIHKDASISGDLSIGHGNMVNAAVRIGAFASVGNHCIINAGVIIEHDVNISDYVQLGAGSIINAGVEIEDDVFIGSGVTVVAGIKIGKGARVGAGSVVISDVLQNQTLFGNPAKPVD